VDYPDVALAVARALRAGDARLGILVDGAGIGSAMAANKVPGIRAAPCADEAAARNAREHNDANVLTLGSRFVDATRMQPIVETFLTTHCTEERHARREGKITAIERSYLKEPRRP
jgi:ribose 5-phosphate isomerase B